MGIVRVKKKIDVEVDRIESLKQRVRSERDKLLKETDFLVMPDYPNKLEGIEEYRQELRDITDQSGFPESVVWPKLEV